MTLIFTSFESTYKARNSLLSYLSIGYILDKFLKNLDIQFLNKVLEVDMNILLKIGLGIIMACKLLNA
jgi:hypothetical protein